MICVPIWRLYLPVPAAYNAPMTRILAIIIRITGPAL